jgi:dodecin
MPGRKEWPRSLPSDMPSPDNAALLLLTGSMSGARKERRRSPCTSDLHQVSPSVSPDSTTIGSRLTEARSDLRVAEVIKQDVTIENGKVTAYRTRLSLSFRYYPEDTGWYTH